MTDLALVTGASSGIGLEIAREHARHGGRLVLVARGEAALARVAIELRAAGAADVQVLARDLAAPGAVAELVETLDARGLAPTILVNNAGFGGHGLFCERDWSDDAAMIDLNVRALTELTRSLLPRMVRAGRGHVLNVASTAALVPGPLQAVYYATKAYVLSLGDALSEELRGTGVHVTTLLPGATRTGFAARGGLEDTPLFRGRVAEPAQVAREAYAAMRAGRRRVYGGVPLATRLQLALAPLMPRGLLLRRVRGMQERG
ncbi:SDR family NAD(P)-dependent oxidoreductase [Lysobacter humi (ex Lee et al. 2017)]